MTLICDFRKYNMVKVKGDAHTRQQESMTCFQISWNLANLHLDLRPRKKQHDCTLNQKNKILLHHTKYKFLLKTATTSNTVQTSISFTCSTKQNISTIHLPKFNSPEVLHLDMYKLFRTLSRCIINQDIGQTLWRDGVGHVNRGVAPLIGDGRSKSRRKPPDYPPIRLN